MNRHRIPLARLLLASALLIAFILSSGCSAASSSSAESGLGDDLWPTDAWQSSTPEQQAMDAAKLEQMMQLIEEREVAVDSVIVIRHGHIVFERYRRGYDKDSSHHIQSVTKSFTSTLVGVAMQAGMIESLDQEVVELFSDMSIQNLDSQKQSLTLEHLLTMSDGMDWHEVDVPYTDPGNTLGQMWRSRDVIQHVLDRPMVRDPGEAWSYNSGTSILLGNVVERASGQDLVTFARQYLFDPIGIGPLYWSMADHNHYHSDGGLYMRPRDMARLGYLMLYGGVWDGERILSEDWVRQATSTHYEPGPGVGYGYQWWTLPGTRVFFASGHYDQRIYVVPEADLVVVFTADIPDEAIHPLEGFLFRNIIAACTDLPAETFSRRFERYGFGIDYGAEYRLRELPLPGKGEVTDDSGMLQLALISYPLEVVNIAWGEGPQDTDAESLLGDFLVGIAQQPDVQLVSSTFLAASADEDQVTMQQFEVIIQGVPMKGLSGIRRCVDPGKTYILTLLTDLEGSTQDLRHAWQGVFQSFACLQQPVSQPIRNH